MFVKESTGAFEVERNTIGRLVQDNDELLCCGRFRAIRPTPQMLHPPGSKTCREYLTKGDS